MNTPSKSGPVLVTGSTGAVGEEICRQLKEAGIPFLAWTRADLDVFQGLTGLLEKLEKAAPRAVLNCVAMTGLDKCFREKPQAFEANGLFPLKLAMASKLMNMPVVQFSTENVFSCNINELTYREADKTVPNTVYGSSKLVGEAQNLRADAPFYVLRLPLLYGPTNRRQIVARLVKELLRGNDAKAATDVFSTPAYTPDVGSFVVRWLSGKHALGPVTHLTPGRRTSLYELICIIAKGIAAQGKVLSTLSSQFPSLEAKPLHGGLVSDVTDALPWDGAIARYVEWIVTNRRMMTDES
jgi:dTDP-4-dehydrorhamnose reductase